MMIKVKPGDSFIVRGCTWDARWEFDCPTVLYEGIKAYTPNTHSLCAESIEAFIEDQLINVVVSGEYEDD